MMPALVWGVPDKTGKIEYDQNNDDDQNDPTAADMVRIHLDNLFRFNLEILTSEKHELESRLINIPCLNGLKMICLLLGIEFNRITQVFSHI